MRSRLVITVDGLAGSGKTSLSKLLAQRIGGVHFSSGLLYRAIGYLALNEGVQLESDNGSALVELLGRHRFRFVQKAGGSSALLLVDGTELGAQLHTPEVSEATSRAARHPVLRSELVDLQRGVLPDRDLVAEGRDMGSVIFPEAPLKFFIQVREEQRIERRLAQLLESIGGPPSAVELKALREKMRREIVERDKRDTARAVAPALPATDAIIIDNSYGTLTEGVERMYHAAASRGLLRRESAK